MLPLFHHPLSSLLIQMVDGAVPVSEVGGPDALSLGRGEGGCQAGEVSPTRTLGQRGGDSLDCGPFLLGTPTREC